MITSPSPTTTDPRRSPPDTPAPGGNPAPRPSRTAWHRPPPRAATLRDRHGPATPSLGVPSQRKHHDCEQRAFRTLQCRHRAMLITEDQVRVKRGTSTPPLSHHPAQATGRPARPNPHSARRQNIQIGTALDDKLAVRQPPLTSLTCAQNGGWQLRRATARSGSSVPGLATGDGNRAPAVHVRE
jgi:hypothetical protein